MKLCEKLDMKHDCVMKYLRIKIMREFVPFLISLTINVAVYGKVQT